jgi:hypothetical protein
MRLVTIQWKPDRPAEQIQNLDHLLACVSEIDRETSEDSAVGISLHHESGAEITVYVSRGRWWFMWTPEDYAEHGLGSYHSTACAELISQPAQTDLIACYLFGHHGEVDLREATDTQSARAALSQFYSSPKRPDALTWTLD